MEYEVLVWSEPLSDGSTGYGRYVLPSATRTAWVIPKRRLWPMNSTDEFRATRRGDIPARYLDPDAPWDGQPLD